MTSGGVVSYFARPNKAIDRAAFLAVVERVGRYRPLSVFDYFGLGGPFVEDCAMVARHFPFRSITSVEKDRKVIDRAKANCPNSRINILSADAFEFVEQHDFDAPSIFWLDYAAPNELGPQLRNFEALCQRLPLGSVAKITLNASPDTLDVNRPENGTGIQELFDGRVGQFMERAGNYCEDELQSDAFTRRGYARTLSGVVFTAARRATRYSTEILPVPLAAFRYADTKQQMLTVTVALEDEQKQTEFEQCTGLGEWPLRWNEGDEPMSILEPSLSLRERMELDRHLPDADVEDLSARLDYQIGNTERDHMAILESYRKFHDLMPYVAPVIF